MWFLRSVSSEEANGGSSVEHVPLLVLGHDVEGLATALALAHQGFPVHVLDRGGDPRDPATAAPGAVAVAPEASRELALLGLLDQVAAHACMPCRLVHADAASGSTLRRAELGRGVVDRYGHPFLLTRRAALRALLAAACATDEMIGVEYGRAAVGIDDVGDGVLVTCGGGAVYHAEALVGADGPASAVRAAMSAGPALSAPYVRYDAPGPVPNDTDIRLWSSPDLHAVVAPVPGGSEMSLVVRVDPHDTLRHVAGDRVLDDLLARQHADLRRAAAGVLARAPSQVHRHQTPLSDGVHHRLTVVGSAAAPLLPHTAYATTLALLDAGALGRAFDRTDGRIAEALSSYAATRRPVWARRARQASEFATLCHADGLVRRMRDRLWANAPVDEMAAIVGAPIETSGLTS